MMKKALFILFAIACSMAALAAPKGKDKQTGDDSAFRKDAGKVYVFGFSQQLADSVVYITDVQEIDSMKLERKTKFLPYRSEFSLQLKEHLEGKKKLLHQTCCVYFANKQKKLEKIRAKLRRRYINTTGTTLVTIGKQEFSFKHPIDTFAENETVK